MGSTGSLSRLGACAVSIETLLITHRLSVSPAYMTGTMQGLPVHMLSYSKISRCVGTIYLRSFVLVNPTMYAGA